MEDSKNKLSRYVSKLKDSTICINQECDGKNCTKACSTRMEYFLCDPCYDLISSICKNTHESFWDVYCKYVFKYSEGTLGHVYEQRI